MHLKEYQKVKNMEYREYCRYLLDKYGSAKFDYMTKNWSKIAKVTRTKEGLFVHHIYEDHAIMLSTKELAKLHPFKWQKAENLCYCNFLEHLFLHILIYEQDLYNLGIGGVVNFLVPELNDIYSGYRSKLAWKQDVIQPILPHKDCYLLLLERILSLGIPSARLCTSAASKFNDNKWSIEQNHEIFAIIQNLEKAIS